MNIGDSKQNRDWNFRLGRVPSNSAYGLLPYGPVLYGQGALFGLLICLYQVNRIGGFRLKFRLKQYTKFEGRLGFDPKILTETRHYIWTN